MSNQYQLSDLITIKHGFAFKGEFITTEENENCLVTPGNFAIGGGFKPDKFKYFSGEYSKDYVLKPGDLIVTMTDLSKESDTLGYSALVPEIKGKVLLHNQRIGLVSILSDDLDKEYLYFLLRSKEYRHHIVSSATGTTVKHTSPSRIMSFKFELPNLEKQKKIANYLMSLDDKIQLNTQTNQTLEQIAQAIYKSWFVDYEPTRAKAAVLAAGGNKEEAETAAMTAISGKTAAALASLKQQHPARYQQLADLAAAFPAALVPADDFGEIPEGWEVKKVGEIAKITKGKKPKNVYPSQESNLLPHILVAALEGKYTEFCETTKMTVSKITNTLILMDGSASGKIAIGHHGVVGSTLAKMELFDNKYWAVLYHFLKSKEKDIQDNTTGTSIPHADKARINDYSLSICDGYILDFYNQFFKKSLFQSIENRRQSYLLESIRDTLLPKLLSEELKQE